MKYCIATPYKINVISCLFKPLYRTRYLKYHEVIIKEVGVFLGLNPIVIKGNSKKREVFEARIISMYLIKNYNKNLTLEAVGKMFNRDHTSVIYSIKQLENFLDTDPTFRNKYQLIEGKIKKMERLFA